MKKNEKGFGAVEILIVLVIVGLIGGTGWYVLRGKNKITKPSETSNTHKTESQASQTKKSVENNTASNKIDTSIHDVDIKLHTEADIDKLPSYIPASFKTYMLSILRNNKPYNNGDIAVTPQYIINKISQVNIKGGQFPVDKNGQGYPGGAPAIWVLTPSGTWDEETLNGPVCKSKNGGLVYEEFVPKCYTNPKTDSFVKNPNGSITLLNNQL